MELWSVDTYSGLALLYGTHQMNKFIWLKSSTTVSPLVFNLKGRRLFPKIYLRSQSEVLLLADCLTGSISITSPI